jgi:hypothetical protein
MYVSPAEGVLKAVKRLPELFLTASSWGNEGSWGVAHKDVSAGVLDAGG